MGQESRPASQDAQSLRVMTSLCVSGYCWPVLPVPVLHSDSASYCSFACLLAVLHLQRSLSHRLICRAVTVPRPLPACTRNSSASEADPSSGHTPRLWGSLNRQCRLPDHSWRPGLQLQQ